MTSPTQRTLKHLKDRGWKGSIVERWIPNPKYPGGGKRLDYMNIIDIISIQGPQTLGIQSTGQDFSGHHRKLTEEKAEEVKLWLSGKTRRLLLIGWRKVKKKRGGKAMVWRPRVREYWLKGDKIVWKDYKN